ncbi:MAG: 50S ribosome-binding GTPase [Acidobacteria bacterium]|nr:50S ribosome-binding GTPase [Acidobacteriota bacterium]
MPANLTPDYLDAEQRFKSAKTTEEKIEALEEMYSTIPKHKGTEKMQAEIKRRLSKLRTAQAKKPARRVDAIHRVDKEGAGQVALAGPPNSGKSALLRRLTHAAPEVAEYPFTTRLPIPGMLQFEDVQIQLVDLPPIHPDFHESWVYQVIRNADAVLLVVDLSDPDLLEDLDTTLEELRKAKVELGSAPLPEAPGWMAKKTLLLGNKLDAPEAGDDLEILRELYGTRLPILPASAETGEGLAEIGQALFDLLELVRVYTKAPGKKLAPTAPYVLKRGAHLTDLAAMVHHDFVTQLKYARVWGHGRFEGQMVNRDYILVDKDIVELHR